MAAAKPRGARLASLVAVLLCSAPLFVLTVRGWANAVLYVAALLGILLLALGERPAAALSRQDRFWLRALVLTYLAPLAATVLSAALRADPYLPQFDSPSRFLLAIPIFLVVLRHGWPVARVMQWVLPIGLALALLDLTVHGPNARYVLPGRITTEVLDPIAFGYMSLAFGLMCLASITPHDWRRGARWGVALRLVGVALGLYFSVRSGSRTGWVAVSIVVAVWAHHLWGRGHRLATAAALVVALLLPVLAYLLVPAVAKRVDVAVQEFVHYSWHDVQQEESSLGFRITYLRIAADVFAQHPLAGVGDTSRTAPPPASDFPYAATKAVEGAFGSGFHNQIVSNAVRNGIGGLLATTALLFVPLLVCARGLRRGVPAARKEALMGMAYCTCLLVSSLSTEVVDLKFTASFYAVMTAILCGAVLGRRGADENAGEL